MAVDITGFERHRREQREKEHKEKLDKALNEYSNENSTESQQAGENAEGEVNTPQDTETPAEGQEMPIEEVKEKLKELGIRFAHNSSDEKLREKLADAVK